MSDAFSDPEYGGCGVKARNLCECAVAVRVDGYNPTAEYNQQVKPSVTLTVLVSSGPSTEIVFGEDQVKGTPANRKIQIPCVLDGVTMSNTNIVRACQNKAGTGEWLVGVIQQGISSGKGNPPWNLQKLPPGDPRRAQAAAFHAAYLRGDFANPEVTDLAGRPLQPGGVDAAEPGGPTTQDPWAPSTPAVSPQFQAPAQQTLEQAYGATQQAPAGPARPESIPEATWGAMDQATREAVAASLSPAGSPRPEVPAGFTSEQWQALPAATQEAIIKSRNPM
jgi:hypothetical protein